MMGSTFVKKLTYGYVGEASEDISVHGVGVELF